MTTILFNLCNLSILLVWGLILFVPKWKISENLISYPWVPLGISFFYSYFIVVSGGLTEADFSSLEGIVTLFKKTTPESAAAGWLHYLAFDFWVATWIIRHSRRNDIIHLGIILPLLCTFMLGPVGIMIYSFLLFGVRRFRRAK